MNRALREVEKWFSDHEATLKREGKTMIIEWSGTDKTARSIKYVFVDGVLSVISEIGAATYLFPFKTLEEARRRSIDEFEAHLQAWGGDKWEYDRSLAYSQFDFVWGEFLRQIRANDGDDELTPANNVLYQTICDIILRCERYGEWEFALVHHFKSEAANLTESERELLVKLQPLGRIVPKKRIAFWLGLQMAIQQLLGDPLPLMAECGEFLKLKSGVYVDVNTGRKYAIDTAERYFLEYETFPSDVYSITTKAKADDWNDAIALAHYCCLITTVYNAISVTDEWGIRTIRRFGERIESSVPMLNNGKQAPLVKKKPSATSLKQYQSALKKYDNTLILQRSV